MKTFIYSLFLGLASIFFSCSNDDPDAEGEVEFYLIESFETIGDTYEIDEATISISGSPVISYEDILSYDAGKHAFKLSSDAKTFIENSERVLARRAFGVYANNELIYTGYFWPAYFSSSCEWTVIDPIFLKGEEMIVELGFPGGFGNVPDERNDKRILRILLRDNKLK